MDRVNAACDYLLELRRTKHTVAALPADIVPKSLAEGYEVQDRLVRKLLEASGGRPIGYKIACTSELAQNALGVDRPFFGVLMSHTSHRGPATLKGSDYTIRCARPSLGSRWLWTCLPGPSIRRRPFASSSARRSLRLKSSTTVITTGKYRHSLRCLLTMPSTARGSRANPALPFGTLISPRIPCLLQSTGNVRCTDREGRFWATRSTSSPGWRTNCRALGGFSGAGTGLRRGSQPISTSPSRVIGLKRTSDRWVE